MPTIAAIASPAGPGGVGVIRISGPDALQLLEKAVLPGDSGLKGFPPRMLRHGYLLDGGGAPIDECLAVYMPGPRSFTGEDVAEIHCHGSPLIVQWALERCLELGARQAVRGEFSKRAFLNGRLDLSQAEAIAELVAAPSREAARYSLDRLSGQLGKRVRFLQQELDDLAALACVAIDFPDDEVPALPRDEFLGRVKRIVSALDELLRNARRAAVFQKGCRILLLGPVNAGKSSLLNALAGKKRALVSEYPGTTRDFVEVNLDFDGLAVHLIDTCGIRPRSSVDPVEAMGMEQSLALVEEADLIWLVLDRTRADTPFEELLPDLEKRKGPVLAVFNKSDLPGQRINLPTACEEWPACEVSALLGQGLNELVSSSRQMLLGAACPEERGLAPNLRQAGELEKAKKELLELQRDLEAGQAYDASLSCLDAARNILDAVLGAASHDELLDRIFSQFCIGK